MAILNITLPEGANICNGKQVTFRAPCSSTGVTGLKIGDITYTLMNTAGEEIGAETSSLETTGISFIQDALVSVIIDTEQNKAFIQNGANEVFIATYGTTTSAEIEAAYQAGKCVLLRNSNGRISGYLVSRWSESRHYFLVIINHNLIGNYLCQDDVWTSDTVKATPTTHASTHASGGSDPIAPEDIGAAKSDLSNVDGVLPVTNGGTGAITAADARANLGITPENIGAAPAYTYGTNDMTAGTSELATGTLYFVYE